MQAQPGLVKINLLLSYVFLRERKTLLWAPHRFPLRSHWLRWGPISRVWLCGVREREGRVFPRGHPPGLHWHCQGTVPQLVPFPLLQPQHSASSSYCWLSLTPPSTPERVAYPGSGRSFYITSLYFCLDWRIPASVLTVRCELLASCLFHQGSPRTQPSYSWKSELE